MSKKRPIVILAFVVFFGLPICWYLFLQAFGENKFDLPVLGAWDAGCIDDQGFVLIDGASVTGMVNEKVRVRKKLESTPQLRYYELSMDSCELSAEMYLVDEDGQIRGVFSVNREEVDRLLAEIDIYVLNLENGSVNQIE